MRLRNIKGSREVIGASKYVIQDAEQWAGKWRELFGNENPVFIEIGMGKGQFLLELARQNPEVNYIGIEKYSSVLLRAIEKQREAELENLRFLRMEAEHITEVFHEGEIGRIYLNFSDPWPKDRHAKRRLTSGEFLGRYEKILIKGGTVEFKTDNRALFDFSLEQAGESGWKLLACTYDLHRDQTLMEGNVMTEYEERFSAMGNPIHKLIIGR